MICSSLSFRGSQLQNPNSQELCWLHQYGKGSLPKSSQPAGTLRTWVRPSPQQREQEGGAGGQARRTGAWGAPVHIYARRQEGRQRESGPRRQGTAVRGPGGRKVRVSREKDDKQQNGKARLGLSSKIWPPKGYWKPTEWCSQKG